MDPEARHRLSRALELVHNAQAHLLENVSPPEDPAEVRKHFFMAWEQLLEASDVLEPLTGVPFTPTPSQSPGTAA